MIDHHLFVFQEDRAIGINKAEKLSHLEIGKGRIIQEGNTIALVNFGARLEACKQAIESLKPRGCSSYINGRKICKTFRYNLIR